MPPSLTDDDNAPPANKRRVADLAAPKSPFPPATATQQTFISTGDDECDSDSDSFVSTAGHLGRVCRLRNEAHFESVDLLLDDRDR